MDIVTKVFICISLGSASQASTYSCPVESTVHCIYSQPDCLDYRESGKTESAVYRIIPPGMHKGYEVYCDMTTDGGGWMVFQRREDGSVSFERSWNEYETGFGNVSHEHWLGFIPLKRLLYMGFYELRIDLEDRSGDTTFAHYKIFNIDFENNYQLQVLGYSGNAGDAMEYHNGMQFSTSDKDNDMSETFDCASDFKGSWWYKYCVKANLNGRYFTDTAQHLDGIFWHGDQDNYRSLKRVEMKIRRT